MNENKYGWTVLLGILVITILFRVIGIDAVSINGDEGDLFDAVQNLGSVSPWQRWAGLLPPMSTWMAWFFTRAFGSSEMGLRMYSAFFGTLTVLVVYFLARLHYGVRIAQLSALFMAIIPLVVLSNRDAHPDSVMVFFSILAIYLWEYSRVRGVSFWLWAGGVVAGLAIISKYNSAVLFSFYWLFIFCETMFVNCKSVNRVLRDAEKKVTIGTLIK